MHIAFPVDVIIGFTALRLYGISGLSWSPLVVVVILWSARIGISIVGRTQSLRVLSVTVLPFDSICKQAIHR